MTSHRETRKLATLVDLRAREVDRLHATLAEKQAVRERFQANLARMELQEIFRGIASRIDQMEMTEAPRRLRFTED